MSAQYEFNEGQNSVIQGLSYKLRGVGIFLMLAGLLSVLRVVSIFFSTQEAISAGAMYILAEDSLIALIIFAVGFWMKRSSVFFQLIVDTKGNDIDNLMHALAELRKFFTLVYWFIVFSIVIILLGIVSVWVLPSIITEVGHIPIR